MIPRPPEHNKYHTFPGLDDAISTNKNKNTNTKKHCKYCGNSSGLSDERGMCISCGGNLSEILQQPPEIVTRYRGGSGSNWYDVWGMDWRP